MAGLPRSLGAAVSLIALALVFAALGAGLWLCGKAVASRRREYQQLFQSFFNRLDAAFNRHHVPALLHHWNPDRIVGEAINLARSFAIGTYNFFGLVVLVAVFVILMLIEDSPFCRRIGQRFEKERTGKLARLARLRSNRRKRRWSVEHLLRVAKTSRFSGAPGK